jgi:hypothetical protein
MPRVGSLAALAALAAAGCATSQTVHITCVPREVSVYVDGRLLEGDSADLRTDRAHKIYAKGAGYEPQLVVLEPEVGADGHPAFPDRDLCLRVVPVGMGRELEIHVEPGAPPR